MIEIRNINGWIYKCFNGQYYMLNNHFLIISLKGQLSIKFYKIN